MKEKLLPASTPKVSFTTNLTVEDDQNLRKIQQKRGLSSRTAAIRFLIDFYAKK